MRALIASIVVTLATGLAAVQGPGGPGPPPYGPRVGPDAPAKGAAKTQGQVAVALAQKLGLGERLSEQAAITLLERHGIVPETGWNRTALATDIFLVLVQKTLHQLLASVSRDLGVPVPATLGLIVATPGNAGGQTFDRLAEDGRSRGASGRYQEAKIDAGQIVPASIETPHPYPIGDDQFPIAWSYRVRVPGASALRLHFSQIQLAPGDSVRVLDRFGQERWRTTGPAGATEMWSEAVAGDTAIVVLNADESDSGWGFRVDKYQFVAR